MFFGQIGIPEFMAYIVKTIEFGRWYRLNFRPRNTYFRKTLFVPIMAVAIITVGFLDFVGGYEFELSLLVMALYLTS
ncbi:hypothetical protein ACEQPO_08545 [Bacillus sp. SL00103]